jgi:hypothetical protein
MHTSRIPLSADSKSHMLISAKGTEYGSKVTVVLIPISLGQVGKYTVAVTVAPTGQHDIIIMHCLVSKGEGCS